MTDQDLIDLKDWLDQEDKRAQSSLRFGSIDQYHYQLGRTQAIRDVVGFLRILESRPT